MKQRAERGIAGTIAALFVLSFLLAILLVAPGPVVHAQNEGDCKSDQQLCFWRNIRDVLTGDRSPQYWETLKEGYVPSGFSGIERFKGKLVSASPETNPTELLLAVDGASADAKIQLIEALPGKMPVGSEIQFAGTAVEFTKSPYMLTLESDTVDIEGWTGK